jgi:hypothetical protein
MIIGFTKRKRKYIWDYFIKNPRHCYIVYNINQQLFKLEYCFDKIGIYPLTNSDINSSYYYDVDYGCEHCRFIFTCSQFCASVLGIKGLCLTPLMLERKIKNGKFIWLTP